MTDQDFYPPSEDSLQQLRRSGWCTGESTWDGPRGTVIQVDGRNRENRIRVEGETAREAWWQAVEAAAAVGMLEGWPRP